MRVFWELVANALSATARSNHGPAKYHLVVERLPGQDVWDWAVWRQHAADVVRHGIAADALTAMGDAQTAIRQWDNQPPDFPCR
jgi:hypothetical protein